MLKIIKLILKEKGNFYPGASLYVQEDLIYLKTQIIAGIFSYGHYIQYSSNEPYKSFG